MPQTRTHTEIMSADLARYVIELTDKMTALEPILRDIYSDEYPRARVAMREAWIECDGIARGAQIAGAVGDWKQLRRIAQEDLPLAIEIEDRDDAGLGDWA